MSGNRKLGRTSSQRKAMLRGMVTYLFENGKIETTYTRAKEIAAVADSMITLAKIKDKSEEYYLCRYLKYDFHEKDTDCICNRFHISYRFGSG